MNNLLCLPLFVLIFIFDPVINSKDENVQISLTKKKHTWSQARDKCSLIDNEHTNITIPNLNSDLMWTGNSGRYSTWVEYLGCFGLKEDRHLVINETDVEAGTQLRDCLLHCKQYNFIGLRQSDCVCLHYLLLTTTYIRTPCNTYPATCQGDQNAFCGDTKANSDAFAIYKKVHVTGRVGVGNCLAVRNNGSYNYVARDCSATAFQICLKGNEHQQNNEKNSTWTDSFILCVPSYMLSRYSLVYNANFTREGTYWLSNTRRWVEGKFTNPEFCIAARVKENGHLERFPIRCEMKLHGMCVSPEHTEVTPTLVSSSDIQAPSNKVLISVIAATSLTILVIVILVFYIRRTYLRSESHPTLVVQTEVVYENESNTLSRNQTANDTIDDMHYQSLNQNRIPIDSMYDILHNAEVDVTSERQSQLTIGGTAEQRQIEEDYQEI